MRSTVLSILTEQPSFEGELSVRFVEEQNLENRTTFSLVCEKKPPLKGEFGFFVLLHGIPGKDREELAKSVSWRKEIPSAEAKELIDILGSLKASVAPKRALGLDGTSYLLVIKRGVEKIEFAWWSTAPEAWKSAGDLASRLLAYANATSMVETQQTDARRRLIKQLEQREKENRATREQKEKQLLVAHNDQCREIERSLEATGLTCPFCGDRSKEIRFIDRSPGGKSYFICKNCGRSFRPEDFQSTRA